MDIIISVFIVGLLIAFVVDFMKHEKPKKVECEYCHDMTLEEDMVSDYKCVNCD